MADQPNTPAPTPAVPDIIIVPPGTVLAATLEDLLHDWLADTNAQLSKE